MLKVIREFIDYKKYSKIQQEKKEELIILGDRVRELGFRCTAYNPGESVTAAIRLMEEYGMGLTTGIASYIIFLPKEKWERELNLDVPAGQYGSFFKDIETKAKKGKQSIDGMGFTIQEAVCKCLINARNAGVL